jgi:predicted TIM-barrel fold metal-dependent hydrolase
VFEDIPVIDAVVHGGSLSADNVIAERVPPEIYSDMLYRTLLAMSPKDDERWILPPESYMARHDPEMGAWAAFGESYNDFGVYHVVFAWMMRDGGSPEDLYLALRERAPGRLWAYGGVPDPFTDLQFALAEIDRQVEELPDMLGLKFYPAFWNEGRLRSFLLDDEQYGLPLLEHAMKRGIRHIGVHKAMPVGPAVPFTVHGVSDVERAAQEFPELTIEIVHGGHAYVEDTALLGQFFANVWINLESVPNLIFYAPDRFGHAIGRLLQEGMEDRIVWGTGTS